MAEFTGRHFSDQKYPCHFTSPYNPFKAEGDKYEQIFVQVQEQDCVHHRDTNIFRIIKIGV